MPVSKLFGLQTLIYCTFLYSLCVAEDGTVQTTFLLCQLDPCLDLPMEREEREPARQGRGGVKGLVPFYLHPVPPICW